MIPIAYRSGAMQVSTHLLNSSYKQCIAISHPGASIGNSSNPVPHPALTFTTANLTSCSVIGSSIPVSIVSAGLPPVCADGPASDGWPLGGTAGPEPFNT